MRGRDYLPVATHTHTHTHSWLPPPPFALQFDLIRTYMENGGSVLVMLGEGGETRFDTNINFLLEEYGVMVNADSVVRSSFYKYHHPKECLVSNGVLNRFVFNTYLCVYVCVCVYMCVRV